MQKAMVEPFLNRKCKLIFKTGFVLYGIPILADDTSLLFRTQQKDGIINYSLILELKEENHAKQQ
jgi:hypothetical protein